MKAFVKSLANGAITFKSFFAINKLLLNKRFFYLHVDILLIVDYIKYELRILFNITLDFDN